MRKDGTMDIYYYYDSIGNLIGATGTPPGGSPSSSGNLFERYLHQPNNVVYCERINVPYNDLNTVVYTRDILQRNVDGEVIIAGKDFDFDGVMDSQNTYNYTYFDGDMSTMQKPDGSIVTFSYSNVIDTYAHLQELSCGREVLQFPCANVLSTGNIPVFNLLKYSKYVKSDALLLQNYQMLPSNFYFKRNVSDAMYLPDGTRTEEMEYFFN